jgi:hypothetical protein
VCAGFKGARVKTVGNEVITAVTMKGVDLLDFNAI